MTIIKITLIGLLLAHISKVQFNWKTSLYRLWYHIGSWFYPDVSHIKTSIGIKGIINLSQRLVNFKNLFFELLFLLSRGFCNEKVCNTSCDKLKSRNKLIIFVDIFVIVVKANVLISFSLLNFCEDRLYILFCSLLNINSWVINILHIGLFVIADQELRKSVIKSWKSFLLKYLFF